MRKVITAAAVLLLLLTAAACSQSPEASPDTSKSITTPAKLVIDSPSPGKASPADSASSSLPTQSVQPSGSPSDGTQVSPSAQQASGNEDGSGQTDNTEAAFLFKVKATTLKLQEKNMDAVLKTLPYKLVSDTTEVLGSNSDTYAGSSVRTVKYQGLELLLFAQKDNPTDFWLTQVKTTVSGVLTEKGIQVGDSDATLRSSYPDAVKSTDDSGAPVYTCTGGGGSQELKFTVADGKITEMTMTYYMT